MTTIKVPRPEDPELAALWDEAKRAVEERITAGLAQLRRDLREIQDVADDYRDDDYRDDRADDDDCCRGDRRLCRCVPRDGAGWSDDS